MKKTSLLFALVCMLGLSGCNTVAGLGRDVEKVGDKVEDKAVDCKDGKC